MSLKDATITSYYVWWTPIRWDEELRKYVRTNEVKNDWGIVVK